MNFFPTDPKQYRPTKLVLRIDVLREMDRAIQEGFGGFTNRHELANEFIEQGLINLRYPDGETPVEPTAKNRSNGASHSTTAQAAVEQTTVMPKVEPLSDIGQTRIAVPTETGAVVENKLAAPERGPMFGMHNRDAPSAWALGRLSEEAKEGPIRLEAFYEKVTSEAWALATQLEAFETKGGPKLAVMLPRNPAKPQSAAEGFRAFGLGGVARKANAEGKLPTSGPFFQWGAVGLVGSRKELKIGLTESGWKLVKVFDGLDFSIPHPEAIAERFLTHLGEHAPADLWGFRTALEGAANGDGRVAMNEYFRKRLDDDYSEIEWKGSVAESVASGYVSRARAWGLMELKLAEGNYALTPAGEKLLSEFTVRSKA